MINYMALYAAMVIILIAFIATTIFAFETENYKKEASAFSIGLFIALLVQILILVDYYNTMVTAPTYDEKEKLVEAVSAASLAPMPSSSAFTKEAIQEHNNALKEFEKR